VERGVRRQQRGALKSSYFLAPSGSTHNAERSGAFIPWPFLLRNYSFPSLKKHCTDHRRLLPRRIGAELGGSWEARRRRLAHRRELVGATAPEQRGHPRRSRGRAMQHPKCCRPALRLQQPHREQRRCAHLGHVRRLQRGELGHRARPASTASTPRRCSYRTSPEPSTLVRSLGPWLWLDP
jgi:hypothetical protein